MDFAYSKKQQDIRQEIAQVCLQLVDPHLTQRDADGVFSRDLWKVLSAHGLDALLVPESFGGRGYGALDTAVALEALGEHCLDTGLVFAFAAHLCACIHPLVSYGGDELSRRWLPKIRAQGLIGAHAVTEIDVGSDVFAIQTRAVKEADGYRLRGQKTYITNAPVADFLIVHARTADNGNFFDLSTFILDRHAPGVTVSATAHEKVGLRTTAMGDIVFDDVWIGEHDRIGAEGSGGAVFQASMEWERTCLFALYLGLMQRQFDLTLARSESRQQFGQAIGDHQAIGHKLVAMYLRLETARLAVHKAAWHLDQGKSHPISSAMAKLLASDGAVQNGLDALQIHGAYGVLTGEIERQLRNSLPSTIFSGTTEVLKNNLARQLRTAAVRRRKPATM
ncbi:MAG: acyl-CoA/acyl-ACP dehydrogenase [Gammaproteobacteria bacterium]|nr:acyl-CoA/acyl-ACP dehydrogenase [Gammaproteobacteria bacterium]